MGEAGGGGSPKDEYEKKYAERFRSSLRNVAKPCRIGARCLIVGKKLGLFRCIELVEEITENPYLPVLLAFEVIREHRRLMQVHWSTSASVSNIDIEKFMNDKLLEQQKAKRENARKESSANEKR